MHEFGRSSLRVSTRRDFCAQACQAASLLALGALAPACGGGGNPAGPSGVSAPQLPTVSGTASGGRVTVPIAAGSPLATVGGAARVQSSAGSFLVVRTGQEAFSALSSTCTHEMCTITGFSGGVFVCPCHGSRFNTGGGVVNGPATRSLPQFATSFADDELTILT